MRGNNCLNYRANFYRGVLIVLARHFRITVDTEWCSESSVYEYSHMTLS